MTRPISPTDSASAVNPQHLIALFDPDEDNPISQTVADVVRAGAEIMRDGGETQDVVVFWSPTTQHANADGIRFGDAVTIDYGGTTISSTIYNVSRIGHIVSMVMAPLGSTNWTAIEAETNITVTNADSNQFGSWITASRETEREDVTAAGQYFRAISEISPGTEVWRELDYLDAEDNTHLTVGARTGTTLELRSSTGDDVLVPSATTTEAGLESAADKVNLDALPPRWTVGTYSVGTERAWAQRIYRCIADRTVSDTDNPATDTTGWAIGVTSAHAGTTNLGIDNRTASSLDIVSDTGSDATVPSASQTEAGLESAADKTKLDGIAAGAQVNVQANWSQAQSTAGDYIRNKPTIPDVSNFRTQTQITTEIAAAIAAAGADEIIDGGEWDATVAYAEHTLVYTTGAGAATYLSRVAVVANTAATSEPGTGSAWETSWLRIGYQDGPPNAFVGAAFTGRHLTLSREGGTNPQTLEVPIGTGQFVLEQIGSADFDVTTNNQYFSESSGETPIDVSDIEDHDILAVQVLDAADSADLHWFTGADMHRNVAAGDTASGRAVYALVAGGIVLRLGIDSDGHLLASVFNASTQDPMPLTLYKAAGNTAPAGSTRVERIAFQGAADDTTNPIDALPIATDPVTVSFGDGAPQIITNLDTSTGQFDLAPGVYMMDGEITTRAGTNNSAAQMFLRQPDGTPVARTTIGKLLGGAPTSSLKALVWIPETTTVMVRLSRQASHFTVDDGWTVDFARWGGGVTGFDPGRIGTATFDLDGTATNIRLTDDTTNAPIVCPAEGWVIAVVTVPGLGLNGSAIWMLAEDLRAADADNTLSASLYTNATNQVFFGAGDQDGGATTDNKIILHHTGTIRESSAGASTVVLPSILEFDVTGDRTVTAADISGKRYSYVSRISQSAHVGSARIVGFEGTAANPASTVLLATLTDYYQDAGSFVLPANQSIPTVNGFYTIREEVYPTGVADTTAPTIYHDFRIQRLALQGQLHFGYVRGGADYAAAALLVDFANDIGDPRDTVAGDYTVSMLPADTNLYRLYWAVPTAFAQPTNWTVASFPITNSLDTAGQSRTIGGVDYTIYVTDSSYDSTANDVTTIAVTTG